jgi:hypothetical protein
MNLFKPAPAWFHRTGDRCMPARLYPRVGGKLLGIEIIDCNAIIKHDDVIADSRNFYP